MDESLPKLDRQALREALRGNFEDTLEQVANAIDNAPRGRVIRDSEEPVRDALDHFRRLVYEKALQLKVNTAQAAFPPSEASVGREATE